MTWRISSACGVSASTISVVIMGTSSDRARMAATERREVLRHALRRHMAALANGDIDGIEAHIGGSFRECVALHEGEVFGEDGDFELARRRGSLRSQYSGAAG